MRTAGLALVLAFTLGAADVNPVTRVWRINPQAASSPNAMLRAVLPEVHAVRIDSDFALVESAGLALQSLSPLDVNAVDPPTGVRHFTFRFPLQPRQALQPFPTPWGVMGAFTNGVPLYSPTSAVSWRDQNLWHQDAVALAATTPIVQSLLASNGRHSPLIGYAFDGFPIYGPWGYDDTGRPRRFRSSYRLRQITRRDVLPDGTTLGLSQEGPPVNAQYPLGTFVEDYEFADGTGDLDIHNGRLAKTPEYPGGTYAYFLATNAIGKPAYPYLLGTTYYGEVPRPANPEPLTTVTRGTITLASSPSPDAGQREKLVFTVRNNKGKPIRFLERVHEKPIHLLVVSSDLSEFAHIHPELRPDDSFEVTHTFPDGGKYWLFADYTMPGQAQAIARFPLEVRGPRSKPEPFLTDVQFTKTIDGLRVRMIPPTILRTGADLAFRFEVFDEKTGQPVTDLEPYLGAWAHMMIVSADGEHFIHAHPLDDQATQAPEDPWKHSHTAPGPSPSSVTTITGFDAPGRYRMWVQFQRAGKVIDVPFSFSVLQGKAPARRATPTADAILISVTKSGFSPERITVPAGKPFRLAFDRRDAENCASSVLFPDLNLKRDLPAGTTTVIDLPALKGPELAFSCGMKMYRGVVLAR